jgi:manganese efflux pump family protein
MGIAALIAWVLTAAGGFYMLATWVSKGGTREPRTSNFPPGLIFGHFGLAAAGLVLWIIYVITDTEALAWVAFVLLLPVALLGFVMLARWIPVRRTSVQAASGAQAGTPESGPPERYFPVPVVAGHGLLAVVTLVLVLLTALGVGGD